MVLGHDDFTCVAGGNVEVVGVVSVAFLLDGFTDSVGDPWVSGFSCGGRTCRNVFV